jgi:hypothetical protein
MSSSFVNLTDHFTVDANVDTETKNKLTEEELLSQMWYAVHCAILAPGCSPNDRQHNSTRGTRNHVKLVELDPLGACTASQNAVQTPR